MQLVMRFLRPLMHILGPVMHFSKPVMYFSASKQGAVMYIWRENRSYRHKKVHHSSEKVPHNSASTSQVISIINLVAVGRASIKWRTVFDSMNGLPALDHSITSIFFGVRVFSFLERAYGRACSIHCESFQINCPL